MDDSAMESGAGGTVFPAVTKPVEAQSPAAKCAVNSTPASIRSTGAASPDHADHGRAGDPTFDALGHPKHTRELFWRYWAPLLAMLAMIGVESTEFFSGTHTGSMLAALMRWFGAPVRPPEIGVLNMVLRKTGHVVGYSLLFLSWLLLLRGSYWLRHEYQLCLKDKLQVWRLWWRPVWAALALLCTAAVAVADELHQMSLPDRTGRTWDMVLDTGAAVVAAVIVWYRARRRCKLPDF